MSGLSHKPHLKSFNPDLSFISDQFIGPIVKVCNERRGREVSPPMAIDSKRVLLKYVLPLNEIVMDFHDTLKSLSSGYASFDYEEYGYEPTTLSKVYFGFYVTLHLVPCIIH